MFRNDGTPKVRIPSIPDRTGLKFDFNAAREVADQPDQVVTPTILQTIQERGRHVLESAQVQLGDSTVKRVRGGNNLVRRIGRTGTDTVPGVLINEANGRRIEIVAGKEPQDPVEITFDNTNHHTPYSDGIVRQVTGFQVGGNGEPALVQYQRPGETVFGHFESKGPWRQTDAGILGAAQGKALAEHLDELAQAMARHRSR